MFPAIVEHAQDGQYICRTLIWLNAREAVALLLWEIMAAQRGEGT